MFLPPETLPDIALLTLVFSGMSRILLIVPSCVAILRLFGVEFREGIRLFRSLEVPGLGAFVRQELVLATLPFVALASFFLYSENDLLLTDLTNPQRVVTSRSVHSLDRLGCFSLPHCRRTPSHDGQ